MLNARKGAGGGGGGWRERGVGRGQLFHFEKLCHVLCVETAMDRLG